jgi:hypothetical protein
MLKNQGEIIQKEILKTGISVTAVAEKISMSRENLYKIFKRDKVDPYLILRIGKAINHDFSANFRDEEFANLLMEPESEYENLDLKNKRLEKELNVFKEKCFALMEENRILLSGKLQEYFNRYGLIKE